MQQQMAHNIQTDEFLAQTSLFRIHTIKLPVCLYYSLVRRIVRKVDC